MMDWAEQSIPFPMPFTRARQRFHLHHPAHPCVLLVGVAVLAAAVTTSATVVHLDVTLLRLARAGASSLPLDVRFAVSELGASDFLLPVALAAAAVLAVLRHWRGALTMLLSVLATQAVVELIKLTVERPRPAMNGAVADASGFSFPSAHSATSMAVYATLALVLAGACRGALRWAVAVSAAALVAVIGLSRVLLAAHYPIDVLAGWLTGGALVVASWLLVRQLVRSQPRALPA